MYENITMYMVSLSSMCIVTTVTNKFCVSPVTSLNTMYQLSELYKYTFLFTNSAKKCVLTLMYIYFRT